MFEPNARRSTACDAAAHRLSLRMPALLKPLALSLSLGLVSAQAVAADKIKTYDSIASSRAVESLLVDVSAAGGNLVAVGERGHVLISRDKGQSWKQVVVPTRQLLTSLFFVDEKNGWAVGHDAVILATTDGGATWVKQFEEPEREAPLLDIWFRDSQVGYAVGAYGALLTTSNGGKTWQDVSDRLDNEDGYHLNAIGEVKGSGLLAVGELGNMFRSLDYGMTWEIVESPYEGSLFGVLSGSAVGEAVVYGLRGHIFYTADFGTTWTEVQAKNEDGVIEYGLSDGARLADGSLLIVGHGGTVLRSRDGGKSFSVFNRPDRISLAGVAPAADGQLVLVGQGGVHMTDGTGASLED
ncbi:WD40/YVTN/BNR-like repeat-containing protein [Atopomonas sediminilitoris]|uniref:WD40/YVTN/BNR-like repeat-containing protein n=1 Tax=Atopomonas sediminilitoris TaxID=2919919 RepID=UPI001F4E09E0|nr:YCF48-related protein [Atopomonas sediminilitoris]MCJ8168935.1 YCF48-related protein [Atopomonas sediminilitoris]